MSSDYAIKLPEAFIRRYEHKEAPWGPLGYITYKRTYARRLEDDDRTEEWGETVSRCVNGLLAIGGRLTADEAMALYDHVFNLRCTFSGRALWQLGTRTVERLGGDSLQNCWSTVVSHPITPFTFLFNELMLGGGVGVNIQAEYVYEMPPVKHDVRVVQKKGYDVDFLVPDNREGWVDLLKKTLEAFYYTGKSFSFSTDCVRPKGSKIQAFGGVASGPDALCEGIQQIAKVLSARAGKKLRPIDCLDICNIIGSVVVAGNVRRSATIALGDMGDPQFMEAKNWKMGNIPNWRTMSNNSVICNQFKFLPDKFWENYNGDGEPCGLVNLKNCRRFGRIADGKGYRPDHKIVCINPCVVGETPVYLADGRGVVPIKQLAEEGKDVPVFCLDDKNKVTVRTMRNPRLTGANVPVVKVTLEDGHVLRVSPNHKFRMSDGSYKEAKDILSGDGIRTLTRFRASIKDIFPNASSKSQDYEWVSFGQASVKAEHRLICEFALGRKLAKGEIVHHDDYNGLNNHPSNLKPMIRQAHDQMHREDKLGDKNPMRRAKTEWSKERWDAYKAKHSANNAGPKNRNFSGEDNDSLRSHALELTKKLGRRFSSHEWEAHAKAKGLPYAFSKWRKDHLGGVTGLGKWAAAELGMDPFLSGDVSSKTVKFYKDLLDQGYDCLVQDGEVCVRKRCEACGREMILPGVRREGGVCSRTCSNHKTWKNPEVATRRMMGQKKAREEKKEDLRAKQLDVFNSLKASLGRRPDKKEWTGECKSRLVSFEISRKSSPFRYWDDLKEAAASFNHRVISVEADGTADVYNGTVDEFHNFFVGGFEGIQANGKKKQIFYNNLQCGELPLENQESCNLSEIFLPNIRSEDEFKEIAALLCKVTKTISCLPFLHDQTNQVVKRNHRLGIGLTGFLQAPERMRSAEVLDRIYKHIELVDKNYSDVLGVKESIKLTTVKPSGTVSLLPGVTPGVHPAYAPYYMRTIRMSRNDALVALCQENGCHVEPLLKLDGSPDAETVVVYFPVRTPKGTICAKDLTAVKQLEYANFLQTHWADNSVSVTVYYRREELPEIKKWLAENYDERVKSVSFLLHSEHGFKQAPFQEISAERYEREAAHVRPITSLSQEADAPHMASLGMEMQECKGGVCPVK